MEYHFKYNITADDFAEFNAYTTWYAPWLKKKRIYFALRSFLYYGFVMVIIILTLNKITPPNKTHQTPMIIISAVIIIAGTIFTIREAPYESKNRAKKELQKKENVYVLDEGELIINDAKIISVDSVTMTEYKWNAIVKYAATKGYFFLYTSSIQGIIIPKRFFTSQNEVSRFDEFLTQKIPLASSFRSIRVQG